MVQRTLRVKADDDSLNKSQMSLRSIVPVVSDIGEHGKPVWVYSGSLGFKQRLDLWDAQTPESKCHW